MSEDRKLTMGMFSYSVGLALVFWASQHLGLQISDTMARVGVGIGLVGMATGYFFFVGARK